MYRSREGVAELDENSVVLLICSFSALAFVFCFLFFF